MPTQTELLPEESPEPNPENPSIDIEELVEHITTNSKELAMMMQTAVLDPINQDLHIGGTIDHLARILARRIYLGATLGVPEETIMQAIERGNPYRQTS